MIPDSTSGTPAAGADDPGTCYLIHFDRRYEHAGHYLGWTPTSTSAWRRTAKAGAPG